MHEGKAAQEVAREAGRGQLVRRYTGCGMGSSVEKRSSNAPAEVRFVPARWLVVMLAIGRLLFTGGRITKFGILGLIWSFTPRALKITAAGVAAAATIVLVGAVAAITLLALQIS
jgi:uncharacterized membrane protein